MNESSLGNGVKAQICRPFNPSPTENTNQTMIVRSKEDNRKRDFLSHKRIIYDFYFHRFRDIFLSFYSWLECCRLSSFPRSFTIYIIFFRLWGRVCEWRIQKTMSRRFPTWKVKNGRVQKVKNNFLCSHSDIPSRASLECSPKKPWQHRHVMNFKWVSLRTSSIASSCANKATVKIVWSV